MVKPPPLGYHRSESDVNERIARRKAGFGTPLSAAVAGDSPCGFEAELSARSLNHALTAAGGSHGLLRTRRTIGSKVDRDSFR
jgi:hypothetical protein